ncbi:MAG: leucine-rich repeat domain-containing protein [Alistipes sp.]|nr:leucine-rich repeat domain-containing protein [Alistipes sp.]
MKIENYEIRYTSLNNTVIWPHNPLAFGSNMRSNSYENGKGIMRFDAPVTIIGDSAFRDCNLLTSITIPDSVTEIRCHAFYRCSKLLEVSGGSNISYIRAYAFSGCLCLKNFNIPESVTTIGYSAFSACHSLTSITIPDKVTHIEYNTFSSCRNLTNVKIGNGVTHISHEAFLFCMSLTNIKFGSNLTSIAESVFKNCMRLKNIDIPDSVKEIGEYAFEGTNLTTITIGKGVDFIGKHVFACKSLERIYCKSLNPPMLWDSGLERASANIQIYVPASAISVYKSNKDWGKFANHIVSYYMYY